VDGDPEKINAERQSGILQQPKRQLKKKAGEANGYGNTAAY
jgi:hypothetical protein